MKIQSLIKKNKSIIDAEKCFDGDGKVIDEAVNVVTSEKPILPAVESGRLKFFSIKENRDRYEVFPNRLPTRDLLPFPVDAHERIGEYEGGHFMYLTIANAYNKAMELIDALTKKVENLEKETSNISKNGVKP